MTVKFLAAWLILLTFATASVAQTNAPAAATTGAAAAPAAAAGNPNPTTTLAPTKPGSTEVHEVPTPKNPPRGTKSGGPVGGGPN